MTHIALVDDETNILTSVSLGLESEGFKVDTYLNGEEALVGLEKTKYDLVVIAVGHQIFKKIGGNRIRAWCKPDGIILDLKNTIPKNETDFTL